MNSTYFTYIYKVLFTDLFPSRHSTTYLSKNQTLRCDGQTITKSNSLINNTWSIMLVNKTLVSSAKYLSLLLGLIPCAM